MNACPNCGQPMPALNSHGKPRKFCNAHCAGTYPLGKVRDLYAEEVDFLTSCGTSPAAILTQLNVTAANLSRALMREGRPELARPFERIVRQSRAQACLDCGKVRASKYDRCWKCARQHRAEQERRVAA